MSLGMGLHLGLRIRRVKLLCAFKLYFVGPLSVVPGSYVLSSWFLEIAIYLEYMHGNSRESVNISLKMGVEFATSLDMGGNLCLHL